MKKRPKLYLIDGSSYIFRAFYGLRQNLSNSRGLPTNALYGFTTMLMKVIREEQPDYVAVVFDSQEKTFRHDLYPEYKSHRSEPPEDLEAQFPYFEPLVEAFNIPTLRVPGYEADDIIGTLARQAARRGMEVVIVSGDKDMMQLVSDQVHMLDTMKDQRVHEPQVEEKFGVKPDQVIEVLGLMGDSSDHIPGVPGVGPKTATELIRRFGSIDNLYRHLDQVEKAKLREKLEANRDKAELSRRLVTIDTGMTLDCNLEDLKFREPDIEKLRKIFSELEFHSLLADLGEAPVPQDTPARTRYEAVLDEKALSALVDRLRKKGAFAVDLETTSLRAVEAEMVGISFAIKPNEAWYVPVGHRYMGAPPQLDKARVLEALRPLLEDPHVEKWGHNIKYDLMVLHNEGIQLKGIAFDSMLAAYVLDPSKRNYNMDSLAMELLQRKTITYEEVAGKGAKQIGFEEVEIDRATRYAAEDADVTLQLVSKLRPRLKGELKKLYEELELPLIEVLAAMEEAGILLDKAHLARLSRKMEREMKKIEDEIHALAGEPFNINSPKQLSVILFEKLGLPPVKKTKSGFSTDVSVLEELSSQHPLPEKILTYRQLSKLKSTYVDLLPQQVLPKTGRVHTSYNQTVAATGRLSSSDPNLQNIPIRTELGREIRSAFIADPGCELLSSDYSQIELRILAHLSEDPVLIRAFKHGEDIHARTAAEIFGLPLEQVGDSERRMAKAVNFGIIYGLSAYGLSRQLKIPPREAKSFIEQYFELYKKVKAFIEVTIEQARRKGYTETLFHRRRYLPDLKSKNKQAREAAERVAINSPLQGSAADLIKVAMIRLHSKLASSRGRSRMLLQVHDELVFECPVSEKKKVEALVRKEMEGVYKMKVPLVVDMAWGPNWREAK